MDDVFNSTDYVEHMNWLKNFIESSDYSTLEQRMFVYGALVGSGYSKDAKVNLPKEDYNNPDILREYIFGQAIQNLSINMPFHQVCLKFIDDWFEMIFG